MIGVSNLMPVMINYQNYHDYGYVKGLPQPLCALPAQCRQYINHFRPPDNLTVIILNLTMIYQTFQA